MRLCTRFQHYSCVGALSLLSIILLLFAIGRSRTVPVIFLLLGFVLLAVRLVLAITGLWRLGSEGGGR